MSLVADVEVGSACVGNPGLSGLGHTVSWSWARCHSWLGGQRLDGEGCGCAGTSSGREDSRLACRSRWGEPVSGSGAGSPARGQPVSGTSDDAVAAGVELRALGPVEAVVDGELVDLGSPLQRALFALLLCRVDRPVAVDALIEELWSGSPPAAAMASLRAYVSNLRRVLEPQRPARAASHGVAYPGAGLCPG